MLITGTGSISGILALEIRDPLLKAYRSYSIRSSQTLRVPDEIRFSPEITDAVARGLITLALEDNDDASQDDVSSSGGGGGSGSLEAIVEDLTGTTTDSYVEIYSSDFENGIVGIAVEIENTGGTNILDFQTQGFQFDGEQGDQSGQVNPGSTAYESGDNITFNSTGTVSAYKVLVKSATPGDHTTYSVKVRGIGF